LDFQGFIKDITDNNWNVHGVEVYKAGELIHHWGDTSTKYPLYSITKSILSIAMGIAWDRGLIDFNKSIVEYLPDNGVIKLSDKQKNLFCNFTLHRLMTMSVQGFPFRPKGDNYLEYTLNCYIPEPEKVAFEYSNLPAYLCSVALSQAICGDAGEFIKEEIFKPLEIEDYVIGYSPEGYFYGPSNTEMSVHSLSKLGLLILNKGKWNDKQIVSPEYLEKATSGIMKIKEGGYGYFIWNEGYISFHGKWKQKCCIIPDQDMVVSFLSDIQEPCSIVESMEKHLGIK